jgi:hypothetical protein
LPWQNGSDPLPIVKTTDMPRPFYCPEWQNTNYPPHLFGMTCVHCAGPCSRMWILSTEASPARTSVLREMEQAWKESEADYSTKLSGLQKRFSQRLSSSKMSQPLELEDFEKSSEPLPIFGMTVGGRVYLPQKLEPRTLEKDGSYLPTPTVNDGQNRFNPSSQIKRKSPGLAAIHCDQNGGQLNPQWVEWLMGYPIGWTELNASVTPWFQSKRRKHSKG